MERVQRGERANERRACERGIWVEGKLAYEIKGAGDSAGDGGGGGQMGEGLKSAGGWRASIGQRAHKRSIASEQAQNREQTRAVG